MNDALQQLYEQLEQVGISRSSPRARNAANYRADELKGSRCTEGLDQELSLFVRSESGVHFLSQFRDGTLVNRCSWECWSTKDLAKQALATRDFHWLEHL